MKKIFTIVVALWISSAAWAQIPTNGLVAYYPFNGNANDASGNGNNGTVNGATLTTDRYGIANSAYSFDGVSNYISIADNQYIRLLNTDFTFNAWILPNNTSYGHLFYKGQSSGNDYPKYLMNLNNNQLGFHINGAGLGSGVWAYSNSITLTSWQMGTIVKSGNTILFYINGVFINQTSVATPVSNTTGFDARIGGAEPNGGGTFNGKLDDIAIYNRSLSALEITQLYQGCTATTSTSTQTACESFTWNGTKYTKSGTYSKTGLINVKGCDSTATLNLTINPKPLKPTIGAWPGTLCLGTTTWMTTAEVYPTYTWRRNGVVVGSNSFKYLVDNGGKYTLTVANQYGCENTSDSALVISYLPAAKPVIQGNLSFCVGSSTNLSTTFKSSSYVWRNDTTKVGTNNKLVSATSAGSYTVTVLDSNGCVVKSNPVTVTSNALPSVSFTGLPSTISTQSAKVTLVGSPTGGTFTGLGVTSNQLDPKVGRLGTRSISYKYTDGNGCSNTSLAKTLVYAMDTIGNVCTIKDTLYIKTSIATGVNSLEDNTIRIYPNPTSDYLIIDNGNVNLMTGYSIQIVNSTGQTVFSSAINQAQFSINVSTWTKNSIYFVKLLNAQNGVVETKKVIVQ